MTKLVIVESPYAGEIETNVAYAREAMADSLARGEAPIASHLIYTQPGILNDNVPAERKRGIEAGFAWWLKADQVVFYTDRGWSKGMLAALWRALNTNKPFKVRSVFGVPLIPTCLCEDMEKFINMNCEQSLREIERQERQLQIAAALNEGRLF